MLEKQTLLNQIDEAINNKSTSAENRKLFQESKQELLKAKTKKEHTKVILKLASVLGALAKLGSIITKMFSDSD